MTVNEAGAGAGVAEGRAFAPMTRVGSQQGREAELSGGRGGGGGGGGDDVAGLATISLLAARSR